MALQAGFSNGLPALLNELNISLILSTYQAGKVIILSSDGEQITQLYRSFDRPMGIAINGDMLALALRMNVTLFRNQRELARTYPKKPDCYDSLYFPLAINKTDFIDTHDMFFTQQGLIAVNTAFSCLVKIDGTFSFQPVWRPPFIKDYTAADYCHLNGMAIDEHGEIAYVTAFGQTTAPEGWRANKLQGGFVMDTRTNEIVTSGLGMPHSPRLYQGNLYVLSSANEELLRIDPATGQAELIAKVEGFIRGLSFVAQYAFIGISKLRKSHTFGDLQIANRKIQAGVVVINIETGEKAGEILYGDELSEIYDVQVLAGMRRPNILNLPMSEQYRAMITPEGARWVMEQDVKEVEEVNLKDPAK
jgi:uncharacterized protein (TIGR03032 family)